MAHQKSECLSTGDGNAHNYGILCQRQFVDRVREALLPDSDARWSTVTPAPCSVPSSPAPSPRHNQGCVVIPTREEKGQRKARTGYALLVLRGAVASPRALPPMARQQLSWAGRVHSAFAVEDGGTEALASLFREIWQELTSRHGFDIATEALRIDVQPKSWNAELCATFAAVVNDQERVKLKLACSAAKVSHVVTLVIQSTPAAVAPSPTIQRVYWGTAKNKEHFADLNDGLNDHATGEVVIEPTDPKTGLDADSVGKEVDPLAPTSRAYYKLAQVFGDDVLASLRHENVELDTWKRTLRSQGVGLDIGASPGGWTQVLHNNLGLSTVVAIDPGVLARRVLTLPGVRHVRAGLSSDESVTVLARHAPYAVIVCDACVSDANELLLAIADTFDRVAAVLEESREERALLSWPLCLVVTLKLPYKTPSSIARNLEKVHRYIPEYLRRLAALGSSSGGDGGDVVASYRVCHLFANSTSERTLVAMFHEK